VQPGLGVGHWVPTKDQAAARSVGAPGRERPRLARGSPRFSGQSRHRHVGPEGRFEGGGQLFGQFPRGHAERLRRGTGPLVGPADKVGAIAVRLEPADEYMHELGPEPNFNESMYFNAYDPVTKLGGFFRLGNRANEGTGEMTCCLYLPNGRVAFMFRRPKVTDNSAFNAAGMRFDVVEPFTELTVAYEGRAVLLDNPLEMADPRAAFTDNPHVDCAVQLTYSGRSAMFGGEPDTPSERPGEEFARGHYEQLGEAVGTVTVGDESWDLHGYGLRDHSWGPRYWQAPWYYRWLTANFGPDFGFMGSRIARRDSDGTRGGFVWDGERLHLCRDFRIRTSWEGEDQYHQAVHAELVGPDRTWTVTGRVLRLIPLRNRRRSPEGEELVTRISEGLTEWTLDDGRIGYGLSEYLDQIIDGQPVGIAE
jgi:hypothetical protein